MGYTGTDEGRLTYRRPLIFMALAFVTMFVLILYSPNFGEILDLLIILPLSGLTAIVLSSAREGRSRMVCFASLFPFFLLGWAMVRHHEVVRSEVRWLYDSRLWKQRVLEEPARSPDGLKCAIWDGWGMFAQDTDVYLVYSPDDALRNYSPTNLRGLPKPVWHVQRLEKYWYSVTSFTNDGWDGCRYYQ
jgi:hypothetical protein